MVLDPPQPLGNQFFEVLPGPPVEPHAPGLPLAPPGPHS